MKEYLSKKEVAEKLSVSVATIDRMIKARDIPYSKFNGSVRFKIAHIERWADKKERPARKIVA